MQSRLVWAAAFLTVALACLARPRVRAADGPGERVLKKHGLKIAGTLAVAEEEAEIKTKLAEARRLSKQLSYSLMQQKGTLSPGEMQKTVKNAQQPDQPAQVRDERGKPADERRFPSYGAARFVSNDAARSTRSSTPIEINFRWRSIRIRYFLNQLKSQPADPKAKEKIDSEVRDRRDAYHQAFSTFASLSTRPPQNTTSSPRTTRSRKRLTSLGKGQREKPKLGPSHEFLTNVKLLEKLEKAESSGETEAASSQTDATRAGAARERRTSSKAADAQADPGSSQ